MPENLNALVVNRTTCRILDFAANVYSAMVVDPESLPLWLTQPRGYQRVNRNTATGLGLRATIDLGLDPAGLDITPSFMATDPSNNADAALSELMRGLHENNLTSQAGFAAWTVTSQQTSGGKIEARLETTIVDNEGNTHVSIANFCLKDLPPAATEQAKYSFQPVLNMTSGVTWS